MKFFRKAGKIFRVDDIVRVEWCDSSGRSVYWFRRDEIVSGLLYCTTIGKLIEITAPSLLIAQSWNEFQFGGCIEIPKVTVRKMTLV